MSDDRIQQGLDAYAEQLQRSAAPAPAAEIRRRAARRRRNRVAGAAFAGVLVVAAGLGTVLSRPAHRPPDPTATSAAPSAPSSPPSPGPSRTGTVTSNVTQLRQLGVDLAKPVLIDVADDGVDRWLQAGPGETVAFTGATRDDSTEWSLVPAPTRSKNRVLIAPASRPGFCVAATGQLSLALQPCREGDPAQTWEIVPAGDSGQFELKGQDGIIRDDGRSGLQTLD